MLALQPEEVLILGEIQTGEEGRIFWVASRIRKFLVLLTRYAFDGLNENASEDSVASYTCQVCQEALDYGLDRGYLLCGHFDVLREARKAPLARGSCFCAKRLSPSAQD